MYSIKLDDDISLSTLLHLDYFTCTLSADQNGNLLVYLVIDNEYKVLTNIKPDPEEIYLVNDAMGLVEGSYTGLVLYLKDNEYFIVDALLNMFQEKKIRACVMQIK